MRHIVAGCDKPLNVYSEIGVYYINILPGSFRTVINQPWHLRIIMRDISRPSIRLLLLLLFLISTGPIPAFAQSNMQTPAEASGFTQYTTYSEMMNYLKGIQASSLDMRLAIYGKSWEGRELPVAIFSRPSVRKPWEALISGKPIAVLAANVHGGERTLRESLLILIRELATRGTEENGLLDDLVILVVPSVNPDGLMATPRPTRGNAWGIDLNRDYMKLEQQALANYAANVINTWHPHVLVDGHNGGSYPYNICYAPPTHASPDQRITQICDRELFPYINGRMEREGYKSFYYSGGNETQWRTGGSDPRIARNYMGFTNSIGILFESPRQETETGIRSGLVAYKAVVEYTRDHPDKVRAVVDGARWETVKMGDSADGLLTVEQTYGPEDFPVTYQISRETGSGERTLVTVTSDSLMKKPVPIIQREYPYAYLLPRDAVDAVALLRRHNIVVEVLQDTISLEVQAYKPSEISFRREYNHSAAVVVEVEEVLTITQRFPKGTYVIPTGQVMGRVAAHLLEPETNDNVVRWNTMDAWLPLSDAPTFSRRGAGREPPPKIIPIYKVMQPTPMPTRIVY